MIGFAAGGSHAALDRVQPVHVAAITTRSPVRKIMREAGRSWPTSQKIGVQGQHNVCFIEPVIGVDVPAERHQRSGTRTVAAGGVVLVPLRTREYGKNR